MKQIIHKKSFAAGFTLPEVMVGRQSLSEATFDHHLKRDAIRQRPFLVRPAAVQPQTTLPAILVWGVLSQNMSHEIGSGLFVFPNAK